MNEAERNYWASDPDLTDAALNALADSGDRLIQTRALLQEAARRWLEANSPEQL